MASSSLTSPSSSQAAAGAESQELSEAVCALLEAGVDDVDAQRAAAARVRLIAGRSGKEDRLIAAGAGRALAQALSLWTDDATRELCALAVGDLMLGSGDKANRRMVMVDEGMLEGLVRFVPYIDDAHDSVACWALQHLVKGDKEAKQALRSVPGVMETLEETSRKEEGQYARRLFDDIKDVTPTGRLVKGAKAGH